MDFTRLIFLFYLVRAEKLIYNNITIIIIIIIFTLNSIVIFFLKKRDSTNTIKKINVNIINIIIGEIMQT
jgi:hypothetical protein